MSLRLFRVTERIASFDWTADDIGDHLQELSDGGAVAVTAMTGAHQGDPGRQLEPAPPRPEERDAASAGPSADLSHWCRYWGPGSPGQVVRVA